MKATPYARKVPDVQDSEDWEQFILAVLKAMRSADKSNWHHRLVVRVCAPRIPKLRQLIL